MPRTKEIKKRRREHAREVYAAKDKNPWTRSLLVATRLNKKEKRTFYAMCNSMNIKPATQTRDMILAFSGLKPRKGKK